MRCELTRYDHGNGRLNSKYHRHGYKIRFANGSTSGYRNRAGHETGGAFAAFAIAASWYRSYFEGKWNEHS
jgi:hypothetical protein